MPTFEFSLMGSGVGECIAIKNLDNKWIIIDSCVDSTTGNPIALDFLNSKGIAPEDVIFLVATHWHDDHVKGFSRLVSHYSSASIILSSALQTNEFMAILGTNEKHQRVLKTLTSGVKELYSVFDSLEKSGTLTRLSWASVDRVFSNTNAFKFYSLSPSDLEITNTTKDFLDLMPAEGESVVSLVKKNPNHSSVVTWFEFNDFKIICGADLEVTANPGTGWQNIKDNCAILNFQQPNIVKIKKVAHHGSENGHLENFWQVTVDKDTYCLLTPYSRSHLPKSSDLERISRHTTNIFCTASSKGKKSKNLDVAVLKTIKDATISHRVISSEMGRISLTVNAVNGAVTIDKSGPADHYTNF